MLAGEMMNTPLMGRYTGPPPALAPPAASMMTGRYTGPAGQMDSGGTMPSYPPSTAQYRNVGMPHRRFRRQPAQMPRGVPNASTGVPQGTQGSAGSGIVPAMAAHQAMLSGGNG